MPRSLIVHENLLRRVAAQEFPAGTEPVSGLNNAEALDLFRAQCLGRALDITSRQMQKAGQGFYTIGSSGHEGMAAVAHALRPTDPAFDRGRGGNAQGGFGYPYPNAENSV